MLKRGRAALRRDESGDGAENIHLHLVFYHYIIIVIIINTIVFMVIWTSEGEIQKTMAFHIPDEKCIKKKTQKIECQPLP